MNEIINVSFLRKSGRQLVIPIPKRTEKTLSLKKGLKAVFYREGGSLIVKIELKRKQSGHT